jgi:glucose/arabinose dehydrogenase
VIAALLALLAAAIPAVPAGFSITIIGSVPSARELVATPNGDLLVGTSGSNVYLVPNADGSPGEPRVFASVPDGEAAGVALAGGTLYVGSHTGVWRVPYHDGDRAASAPLERIASVRTIESGGHSTTSVAIAGARLYASVGSSCNACVEKDPTRATILEMAPDGAGIRPKAVHIRNAIALATNPETDALWAGVAGQDELAHGHPYEIFDDVTAHAGTVDYGWPDCYENRRLAYPGHDCSKVALPLAVFPAYETPIGAAFYPLHPSGAHAFPEEYRGGAFVALHGSWHVPLVAPRVAFVPMHGDDPLKPVDWNDPDVQWQPFVTGFQLDDDLRIGRPTGVAVGPDGSLFIADDLANVVYRIRPVPTPRPSASAGRASHG